MIGSASCSDDGTTSSISEEYDIGKLLDTNVNLHNLQRTLVQHIGNGSKS